MSKKCENTSRNLWKSVKSLWSVFEGVYFPIFPPPVSCDRGDLFSQKPPLYSDLLRQNSPRVSCENLTFSGRFFEHFLRLGPRTYVPPFPSRLSWLQTRDGIGGNICASFAFPGQFVENPFLTYRWHMCRLSISAKSLFPSRVTFWGFFRCLFFGPKIGLEWRCPLSRYANVPPLLCPEKRIAEDIFVLRVASWGKIFRPQPCHKLRLATWFLAPGQRLR